MITARWKHARNLLCIRLDNLDDVLMSTPAMRALKDSLPGSRITLLASDSGAAGARHIPEIDDVIRYASPWMKSSADASAEADFNMARTLKAKRFDAAAIFTAYSQSALPAAMLCHLAGISLRLAHCRENPYHLLSDWLPDPEPQDTMRHEVRRQLDLVASVGCTSRDESLSFRVPEQDAAWAQRHLTTIGIDLTQPWILLHPGATAASRRYPSQLWAAAINLLFSTLKCPVLFCGGATEITLIDEIRAGLICPSYSLAGKLELGRFAAVLARASVLLCNNSGPAHLAAALGTPVIDLYALTHFQHTPWQVPSRVLYHDVPCAPCYKSICPQDHHDCLSKVTPEQVAHETLDLLRETGKLAPATEQVGRAPTKNIGGTFQPLVPLPPSRRKQRLEPLTAIVIRNHSGHFKR